ncbi:MAG: hypothetical protein V1911_01305 [Candidatus Micrarchaeota archaeon]
MATAVATVRLPLQLKKDIDEVVKENHFKNTSDFLLTAARAKIVEYGPSKATLLLRKKDKEEEERYMKMAHGDKDKAWDLYCEDLIKIQKEYAHFFKGSKSRQALKL